MSDPVRDLQDSFARNYTLATAPTDHMLLEQAKATAGHISLMAVSEEYDRLILAKYHRPRGFLSRLFGSWFSIAAGAR